MKILINYQEYADVEVEKGVLEALGDVEIVESRTRDEAEFADEVRDAEGVLVQYAPCTARVIAAMERCRVIVRYGIAVDTIDLAAARARGITVCNVPSYCLDEVSNHALALVLALHRRLPEADRLMRNNQYSLDKIRPILRLAECAGGLVGFGHIARALTAKLKPLVREVLAYDPFVSKQEIQKAGVVKTELGDLFARSDFISIHVPVTAATRGLVSRDLIARMKPTAYLINTARGPVVDEDALIEALGSGRIAGAGLDVFETEPLPADSPLRSFPNVILTGHYGWYSEGAIRELKETAAGEVVRVLSGAAPLHEVG